MEASLHGHDYYFFNFCIQLYDMFISNFFALMKRHELYIQFVHI